VVATLGQVAALRVISRTSTSSYRASSRTLPEIARDLGADGLVEGAVVRAGARVRVTVRLIDAKTDTQIWNRAYENDLSDILLLQGELAQSIATAIQLELTPRERVRLESSARVHPESYQWFLHGRSQMNRRNHDGVRKAIECFTRSIELDEAWALAHVGLADAHCLLFVFGLESAGEASAAAGTSAARALERDPFLGEAYASRAVVRAFLEWRWDLADADFKRAIQLNPGYAGAYNWYANYLAALGRPDEAVAHARRALVLDPLNLTWHMGVGHMLLLARRYDEAIEQERKTLEFDGSFAMSHWILGLSYEQTGRIDDAVTSLQMAAGLSGHTPYMTALLGRAYALAGRKDDAAAILGRMETTSGADVRASVALIRAALGDDEGAFALLDEAVTEPSYPLMFIKVSPVFDSLRRDSRFENLVQRVGLA